VRQDLASLQIALLDLLSVYLGLRYRIAVIVCGRHTEDRLKGITAGIGNGRTHTLGIRLSNW
jgi:hypothetical protein